MPDTPVYGNAETVNARNLDGAGNAIETTASNAPPTAAQRALVVARSPVENAGANGFSVGGITSATGSVVKAGPGSLLELSIVNNTVMQVCVKLYNKATAPVAGTDNPWRVIQVDSYKDKQVGYGELGARFPAGISFAVTMNPGDLDTTAIAAGGVRVSGTYL